MSNKLRFALIGCGRIARKHAQLLASGTIEGAELVAVCDTHLGRAVELSDMYGVPCFVRYENMFDEMDIDVVCILTESGNHSKHIIDASKRVKNILVEKPLALNTEDADWAIRACEINDVRLFVVKQNRFNLPVQKAKEAIKNNRFGRMVLGTTRVRWCRTQDYFDMDDWRGTIKLDGGILHNQASHHIDLLLWLMGDVKSVFAKSDTFLCDIETDDTAVVILRFASGALGVIEATTATRPGDLEGSISILGEKGSVEIAGFAVNKMKTWNFEESIEGDEDVLQNSSTNPDDVYGFGHKLYYEHVVDCITNDKEHLVDGIEARKSLRLIEAIYESIKTKCEVNL